MVSYVDCSFRFNRSSPLSQIIVLVWLYKYFDMSITDESYVDETWVWCTKL